MAGRPIATAFVRLRFLTDPASKAEAEAQMAAAGKGAEKAAVTSGKRAGSGFASSYAGSLKKGVPAFAKEGEKAGTSWGSNFGGAAGQATTKLAKIGGIALLAAAAASVKMATDFQASMKRVQTQAGASSRDVQTLSNQVLNLGTHTQQGPEKLAESLFHLKSVGLDNVNAMKALKVASDFAAVGGADLEQTTNALAGAWRSGIKGAGSFTDTAATLNAVIGAGNIKMEDLNAAIGTGFLPSARSFGISLRSVGSALALMTDEGIPAVVAATRLRMSFSLLAAPSAHAEDVLSGIGITGLKLANTMRSKGGLVAAIGLLKEHLDASGLSASKQAILLSHAFGGGRSSSAILTLINNYSVLQRKQEQINKSIGKFGPAVAAQQKTAGAAFALLRSNVEVLGIRIGTVLIPVLAKFAGFLSHTNVLIPALVGVMAVLTAAIIAQAAAWLLTPFGQIAAGITLIVAGSVLLVQHWGEVKHVFDSFWNWVKGHAIFALLLGPLGAVILAAIEVSQHWRGLVSIVTGGAKDIGKTGGIVGAWANNVVGWFGFLRHNVAAVSERLWLPVVHAFDNFKHALLSGFDSITHYVSAVWRQFWRSTVGGWLKDAFNAMTNAGDHFRHNLLGEFDAIRAGVMKVWNFLWAWTIGLEIRGFKVLIDRTSGFRHNVRDVYDGLRHDVAHIWDVLWNNTIGRLKSGTGNANRITGDWWHHLTNGFDSMRHNIAHIWDVLWDNTVGRIQRGVTAAGNALNHLKQAFLGPIKWVLDHTIGPLDRVWNALNKAFGSPLPHLPITFGFAQGGHIGKITAGTTPTADNVLIRASKDETVISAAHSRILAPALAAVGVPGYAGGGKVGQNPPGNGGGGGGFFSHILHGIEGVFTGLGKSALTSLANIIPGGAQVLKWLATNAAGKAAGAMRGVLDHTLGSTGVSGEVRYGGDKLITAAAKAIAKLFSSNSGSGNAIVSYAMKFLGKIPYVWGGTSVPGGADCSGFTQAVYKHFGINAPRTSEAQGAWVKKGAPTPGGLAFWISSAGGPPPGHVGIVKDSKTAISQGGGMGPRLMGLHDLPLMYTGTPPGGFPGGAGGSIPRGPLQQIARQLLQRHGWGNQWAAFDNLENREAGWNIHARNPSSGAYGLAQFINGPGEYAQYGGNSSTGGGQLVSMMNYIAQRYGSANAAWGHEQRFNWYGDGLHAMADRPTMIGVGERGRERVDISPVGAGGLTAGERAIIKELRLLRQATSRQGADFGDALNGTSRNAAHRARHSVS